ncbi:hypothetical protein DEA8626_03422 [Defluviimonas aquaemixtae]|uniref:DUF6782 domain-containing protein n=1 Tax=Albidovulum aquaemixtae TaxID=1542388 RepID=A0A2R8BM28_9RHOB|nr:DUF6782 family putative metallopeptidase [Defluviimonas aquaemixtae]SPH24371.1 hypothetical protein DEA8626_03422 [Defluviimonas aquaemixtae]
MLRAAVLVLVSALPARAEPPIHWNSRAADLCLLPPYTDAATPAQTSARDLISAIAALEPAPDPLLNVLKASRTAICEEDRPSPARGSLEVEANLIALRSDLDFGQRLLILIHELRHLVQYDLGYCPTIDYDLGAMELFTYMVEADAQAIATYYAWRLAKAGRPEAWDAVRVMPEYADVAATFERAIASGTRPEDAVAEAFARWFDSPWRVETYRIAACSAYLDRLDKTKKLRSYEPLPEGYFDALCRLSDGTPYRCEAPGAAE